MIELINIMAVSLDGKISGRPLQNDAGRMSFGFGCEADHKFVRSQLATCDAVITGANSVRSSGGIWDCLGRDAKPPIWLIFTNEGLDQGLRFWNQSAFPRILFCRNNSAQASNTGNPNHGVETLTYSQKTDSPGSRALSILKDRGAKRILLFGGGHINKIFYEENLVDELNITISPVIVGRSDAPSFVEPELSNPKRATLLSSQVADNHLFLRYRIHKT